MNIGNESGLTARGAATRSRIIDAAADLVRARGLANTSLDDVLLASKASKSQLYHYFADRDDLILAVVQHQITLVLTGNEPLLGALDSLAGLRHWRDELVRQAEDVDCAGGCPLGSLVGELGELPRSRAAIASGFEQWAGHFSRGFTRMKDRGELVATADPKALAGAMLAALQGGLLLSQVQRSSAPLRIALDMAVAHAAAQARH